jgi:NAD(P)-dependent dehydrogenase (short-subunit alcohol dehydrogenase family)
VRVIEAAGGRAIFFRADVRKDADMRELASFAEASFGGLHVPINNASAPRGGDQIDEWTDALETDSSERFTQRAGLLRQCDVAAAVPS